MEKVDYKKQLKEFYAPKPGKPTMVTVPVMNFIMIDGKGDPNTSQEYRDAIEALYAVAYASKFMCKRNLGKDFAVMPLEGLWWTKNMADFNVADKSNWLWRAMIMQPKVVTAEIVEQAIEQTKAKKQLSSLDALQFRAYDEGRSAQVMYVGPYADEGPTVMALHEFIKQQGGSLTNTKKHHHEIYLGDPRRVDPARLKTVIRQPF